jgi:hypothetical protein
MTRAGLPVRSCSRPKELARESLETRTKIPTGILGPHRRPAWVLCDATYGLLGSTTVLGL